MKSKEDMIEIIEEVLRNAPLSISQTRRSGSNGLRNAKYIAEAVLKALCGALPDTLKTHEYYNQLKQWGE